MGKLLAAAQARRLGVAAAVCAALLAGAEAGLRAARVGTPVWHHPDPTLGWTLRPYAGSHGGGQYGEINAFGQRDNPHEADKREGVYRIAVLGDERSEALGVPLRAAWWRQLPAELDRCAFAAGKKIEMLNFGVAGYSTAQESIVLETAVMRYRPDLVLLQFSSGKDVRENSRALATRLDRPFYSLGEQGRLRLDASFLESRDFERRSQFRYELAREIADRSRVLQLFARASPIDPAHADAGRAAVALGSPADARWEEAWRVTEAILARMREYAERNAARFAVVAAPSARLASLGERHAIPMITLTRPLPAGEWTPEGHRIVAQAVAAGLCRPMTSAAGARG